MSSSSSSSSDGSSPDDDEESPHVQSIHHPDSSTPFAPAASGSTCAAADSSTPLAAAESEFPPPRPRDLPPITSEALCAMQQLSQQSSLEFRGQVHQRQRPKQFPAGTAWWASRLWTTLESVDGGALLKCPSREVLLEPQCAGLGGELLGTEALIYLYVLYFVVHSFVCTSILHLCLLFYNSRCTPTCINHTHIYIYIYIYVCVCEYIQRHI